MIYTVTFNPAIDYVVRMEKLEIGSVNRSREEALFYGGKGINVSTVLKNLGVDSVALGFVAGFTGKAIEEGVAALGVKADFITVSDGVSRINVKLKAGEETEINGKGPNISDAELEELYKKLDGLTDGDCLVLAGAIPPSLPSDVYEKIMARLAGKKVDIVVDATKDLLLNVLKYHPFLIKPNNFELGEMFGVTLHSDEEIEEYAKRLQALGARNVAISMAGDGSMLLTETGETYRMGVPKGKVVNSVGAGDSMVAGFIASYFAEHDYKKALKYGAATGSATAFSEGLATKDQVEKLLEFLSNTHIFRCRNLYICIAALNHFHLYLTVFFDHHRIIRHCYCCPICPFLHHLLITLHQTFIIKALWGLNLPQVLSCRSRHSNPIFIYDLYRILYRHPHRTRFVICQCLDRSNDHILCHKWSCAVMDHDIIGLRTCTQTIIYRIIPIFTALYYRYNLCKMIFLYDLMPAIFHTVFSCYKNDGIHRAFFKSF